MTHKKNPLPKQGIFFELLSDKMLKRIAIFASGSGTNTENIIRYFRANGKATVELVLCNNPNAGVIEKAENLNLPCILFNRHDFYETDRIELLLVEKNIDLVVLAGFLWLLPEKLIKQFAGRIINIHPALLPKYGGKGFYGRKVHEAVLQAGEKKSGITIHYVNDKFDEGEIIAQFTCDLNQDDTVETIASKIYALEYEHYPKVIEQLLEK
jgi:phosphoribosylglycinamide formyltransferase-1